MQPGAASVGELPARGEAAPARRRGARGSEDAGTSSETGVGIPRAESPRFPGEGSSPQGQPGPKPRARAVGEGRQADIPAPRATATDRRGDGPYEAGPGSGRPGPVTPGRREASPSADAPGPSGEAHWRSRPRGGPKKSRWAGRARPYRNRHRWAGRAYRGERADRGQGTRQNGPVT